MGKLHELLAVEEDLKAKAKHIVDESLKTFKDKQDHFVEQIVKFIPNEEHLATQTEGERAMVTTVAEKLEYTIKAVTKFFDASVQKEMTNTEAFADVVLSNGSVLLQNVPATGLLFLERELAKLYDLFSAIPTLEPGVFWQPAANRPEGIFATSTTRIRTKKKLTPVVLYEATQHHPAQVEKISEDVPSGTVESYVYSSKLSPALKAELIARLDDVKQAVKKARQRANSTAVINTNVGHKIFEYVLRNSV